MLIIRTISLLSSNTSADEQFSSILMFTIQ